MLKTVKIIAVLPYIAVLYGNMPRQRFQRVMEVIAIIAIKSII